MGQDGSCQQWRDQVDAVIVQKPEAADVYNVGAGNFDDGFRLRVQARILKEWTFQQLGVIRLSLRGLKLIWSGYIVSYDRYLVLKEAETF